VQISARAIVTDFPWFSSVPKINSRLWSSGFWHRVVSCSGNNLQDYRCHNAQAQNVTSHRRDNLKFHKLRQSLKTGLHWTLAHLWLLNLHKNSVAIRITFPVGTVSLNKQVWPWLKSHPPLPTSRIRGSFSCGTVTLVTVRVEGDDEPNLQIVWCRQPEATSRNSWTEVPTLFCCRHSITAMTITPLIMYVRQTATLKDTLSIPRSVAIRCADISNASKLSPCAYSSSAVIE
jgi:hypothetical protein